MNTWPAGVVEIFPDSFTPVDNVVPSLAIDKNGQIFYLIFTATPGTNALIRLFYFPENSVHGQFLDLPVEPNASAKFMQYRNVLYVLCNHNTYSLDGRQKRTHILAIPVKEAVCPCEIY